MKLDGLLSLYKSMKYQNIERYRFEYNAGQAVFDIFFFIDGSPYLLLFGVKAKNFSFELKVEQGFKINHQLDREIYKKLCEVLELEFDPNHPFSPFSFFSNFNKNIPARAYIQQKAEPHEVAPYKNIAEEVDKIYFVGWRDNSRWGTNVQQTNLDKTKELLGETAHSRCKQKNISSCWTHKENMAIEVILP